MIKGKIFSKLVSGYRLMAAGKATTENPPMPVRVVSGTVGLQQLNPEEPYVEKEKKRIKFEGLDIPEFKPRQIRLTKMKEEEEKLKPITYPLIPSKPKRGEPVFAYVKIFWDERSHKYIYQLTEPEMSLKIREILGKLKDLLEQRLDVDFSKLKRFEATDYLIKQVDELVEYFSFRINETEKKVLRSFSQDIKEFKL
jgi:hypothetical protein